MIGAATRAFRRRHDRGPLDLLSAWAVANHVVLGQLATADYTNELTALPGPA